MMELPSVEAVGRLKDDFNNLEVVVFPAFNLFVPFWKNGDGGWRSTPRHYSTVIGAIRAAYVWELKQY